MNIVARARAAARYVERSAAQLPTTPSTAADLARTAVRLAGLLGITPDRIGLDWPWTGITVHQPLILHVTDTGDPEAEYVFCVRDPLYDDEPFHVIGACPECQAPVPVAEICNLADLAVHLDHGPEPMPVTGVIPDSYSDLFLRDPAHRDHCRFGDDH